MHTACMCTHTQTHPDTYTHKKEKKRNIIVDSEWVKTATAKKTWRVVHFLMWPRPAGIPVPTGLDTVAFRSLSAPTQDHRPHRPTRLSRPWLHAGGRGVGHGDLPDPCGWLGAQRAVPEPQHWLLSPALRPPAGLHRHCCGQHLLPCWTSGCMGRGVPVLHCNNNK